MSAILVISQILIIMLAGDSLLEIGIHFVLFLADFTSNWFYNWLDPRKKNGKEKK